VMIGLKKESIDLWASNERQKRCPTGVDHNRFLHPCFRSPAYQGTAQPISVFCPDGFDG